MNDRADERMVAREERARYTVEREKDRSVKE
jgi:hypothetical protein